MKSTIKYFQYLRKSMDDTRHQILSLPGQKSEMSMIAKREGYYVCDEIEESQTAKKPGRPKFNNMLDRIERGEANGILCWKIDRLYRNPVDEGRVRWMLQCGVIASIRTAAREYFPQDAGLLMAVESGVAVEHILSMATNLKRTHEEKLRRGQWPGQCILGFMFDHASKNIVHDPETVKIVRTLFDEFATGRLGLHSAGLRLQECGITTRNGHPYSKSQIRNLLSNRLYTGVMEWKGTVHEGKFAPIITAELFEKVQRVLKVKSKPRKVRNGHQFPFCGVFRCSCGAMITAQWATGRLGGRYRYHRCSRHANRPCDEPYIREELVTSQCLETLRPLALTAQEAVEINAVIDEEARKGETSLAKAIVNADNALAPLEDELRELTRLLVKGVVDEDTYCHSKEELILEKTRLKQERQRLQRSREENWIEPARKFVNVLETLGKMETKPNCSEISGIVQKIGLNPVISRKTVSFSISEPYAGAPSLLASARVASETGSASDSDLNWWSTKWCAY